MKKAFFVLVGLFLSACTRYLEPLCDETNRVDVPNLEGRFSTTLASVTAPNSQIMRMTLTVARTDRGSYTIYQESEPSEISVCRIGGHLYAEGKVKLDAGFPRTSIQVFRLEPLAGGSFDLVFLGVDSQILKSRGVPFEIVETQPPDGEPAPGSPGSAGSAGVIVGGGSSFVLVDNSKLKAKDFVQLLDPLSVKMTWLAAPPAP